jgi:hypothetical protein
MILKPAEEKEFSKASLPTSESPVSLFKFYSGQMDQDHDAEELAEYVHDIVAYSIPEGLNEADFFDELGSSFKNHPFVSELVEYIRNEGSLPFGAVKAWIAKHCSDTPRPYPRDLIKTTRHLYDWLSYFFDEITWDTPNYSMVIYWKVD